jgi:hypothetical protein
MKPVRAMDEEVQFTTGRACVHIDIGDRVDVTTYQDDMDGKKFYVLGAPKYRIELQSWADLVSCVAAVGGAGEDDLRQMVLGAKTNIWRHALGIKDGAL